MIAPFGLRPSSSARVQVWNYGIPSSRMSMPVQVAAPGLFTRNGSGTGPVSVINQDGTVNSPSPPGSIATLYGTGGGLTDGATDGGVVRSAKSLLASATVTIDGRDARVLYAGAAPSLPHGVFQINVEVPAELASGTAAPVIVRIGGAESRRGTTLEIR